MRVRILSSALEDLAIGRKFYDNQQAGIGDYFFDSVFSDIDSLSLFGGIHRLLARRFPYAVYYKMDSDGSVIVYRVMDCRRDPAKTRRALKSSQ
ncbi:MAG TPA: type II toxin-antitoxin system RelE/ParE family toxin [Verrucomicrobiae bacterium]|jgi:hypothetical protein|nr:type II toxin-antitoxin system RelE/ParE family toxin [Verrucomicrobiae bacterium]